MKLYEVSNNLGSSNKLGDCIDKGTKQHVYYRFAASSYIILYQESSQV